MIHPVGACATAAVSLEVAHDKITSGKALAVLAGGFDDLTPEGMLGFADMGATASQRRARGDGPRAARGLARQRRAPRRLRRGPGRRSAARRARRRRARARPARCAACSPTRAASATACTPRSPPPGLGALASAPAAADRRSHRHGLTADDIGVVSKHDTSTEMNDPAEADLHERLQDALGRTPGNPLLVVSQKTVTGHAKGGAAAWQLDGVLRMLDTGIVPGNRNLESVDPLERDNAHLTLGDRPIRLAEPLKAALITSLGFGHVSAVLGDRAPGHASWPRSRSGREDYLRARRPPPRRGRPAPPRDPHRPPAAPSAATPTRAADRDDRGRATAARLTLDDAGRRSRRRARLRASSWRTPRAGSWTARSRAPSSARRRATRAGSPRASRPRRRSSRPGRARAAASRRCSRGRPARDRGRRRRLRPPRPAAARRGGGAPSARVATHLSFSHDGRRRSRSSSSTARELLGSRTHL